MARPQPRPSLAKAPTKEHPLAPAPSPGEPASIASTRGGDQERTLSAVEPRVPAASTSRGDAPRLAATEGSTLAMFATRLDADLRRQVKVHAAQQNQTIQEVTEAALRAYLADRLDS